MQDEAAFSISQFRQAWGHFASASPRPRAETVDGLEYVFCGIPVPFFNVALLTGADLTAEILASRGRAACDWAAGTGLPWLFLVTMERLAGGVDAEAALAGCGLAPAIGLTGMRADTVTGGVPVPEGLQLVTPSDDEECAAIVDVNTRAYGMDLEASKPILGTRAFWAPHVAVLGRVNGEPATSSAVLMVDGYRYVALVATDPAHQRRGFAAAAMRRSLDLAAEAHGPRPSFLHATDAGRPVYERMGYQATARHVAFMEKRFLESH